MARTSSSRRSPSDPKRPKPHATRGHRPHAHDPHDIEPAAERQTGRSPVAAASDTNRTVTSIGARKPGAVRIVACRDGKKTESTDLGDVKKLLAQPGTNLWIDLAEPDDDQVKEAAETLGLHPLIAEDIAERNQRSKVETFDEIVHVVLFALHYDGGEAAVSEVDFVLGERYLLSAHDGTLGSSTTAALRFGVEHALTKGPDYLFYAIADTIVDGYFPVLDEIGDDIDGLQDRVMESASGDTLQRLFALKRELSNLRRATSPAREIFNQLTNREIGAIDQAHIVYFRDVYDHLIRVTDELDNYRDLVSGTLDIYVSIVNNDLSRIMKRLTGVTVILAGIGAIAGIFGMSEAGAAFQGLEAVGFWLVTLFVVILAVAAAAFLRKIDWI
ncbi:MAG TPA: magnesium transporter CorA family protein [Candidatus Limnocylindrales bacterium]|nr:magnesium transporter CorA family protein [Candidatus Limnocylindrales bacterium]